MRNAGRRVFPNRAIGGSAASTTEPATWVFPGQGSQYVGMGLEVARIDTVAGSVFTTADQALGFGLSNLIFHGPDEKLQQTANQQPAILAVSIAYFAALRERGLLPEPDFVAGHSLGEYSALVAAGALDLTDALKLVRRRGELMQEHGAGAMAALIGMQPDAIAKVADETGVEVANYNAPGQTTISGRRAAIEQAVALAKERGAKRAVLLPVSAAFHSSLMAPVVDGMRPLIEETAFQPARVPLVANIDARPIREPDEVKRELLDHICAPVRWIDVVQHIERAGVATFYEIGPGKVLSGLIGRIVKATTVTAESMLAPVEEIEKGRTRRV